METQDQEWCTIKEYKKINPWAREVKIRCLQIRAKEGMLLDPVKKVLHPSGKYHIYLVSITDPKSLKALRFYRSVKEYQKANILRPDSQMPDPYWESPDNDDAESPRSLRLSIRITIGTPIAIVMQSKLYRDIFLNQLEDMAERSSKKTEEKLPTRRNQYRIPLKTKTFNYVKSYAGDMGLTVSAAFLSLFMEFLQANQSILRYAAEENMQRGKKNLLNQQAVGSIAPPFQ
ncbi:MAG: hypothetical protein WC405_03835 [Syntrophales bacterium]